MNLACFIMFSPLPRRLLALVLALTAASHLQAIPSVADFFKQPELSDPSVSPDARYVFYLTPGRQRNFDLNAFDFFERSPMKFDLGQEELFHYRLLGDGRMILRLKSNPVL